MLSSEKIRELLGADAHNLSEQELLDIAVGVNFISNLAIDHLLSIKNSSNNQRGLLDQRTEKYEDYCEDICKEQ